MPSSPELNQLVAVIDDARAHEDLAAYFGRSGASPRYTGGRFELLAGGGARPETVNRITADDLIAVELLGVQVPAEVAVDLLEGDLGRDVAEHLTASDPNASISDPIAEELLADRGRRSGRDDGPARRRIRRPVHLTLWRADCRPSSGLLGAFFASAAHRPRRRRPGRCGRGVTGGRASRSSSPRTRPR